MKQFKKIVELQVTILYKDENGENYRVDGYHADDKGIKPEETQTAVATLLDGMLVNEGFIEVTRKELKGK